MWPEAINTLGAADIQNMYQQYKMIGAEMTWTLANADTFNTNTGNDLPFIYICQDPNSVATPGSEQSIKQFDNCISHQFSIVKPFTLKWKPQVILAALEDSIAFTAGVQYDKEPWVSTTYLDTIYSGVKFWIRHMGSPAGAAPTIRVQMKCTFALRGLS